MVDVRLLGGQFTAAQVALAVLCGPHRGPVLGLHPMAPAQQPCASLFLVRLTVDPMPLPVPLRMPQPVSALPPVKLVPVPVLVFLPLRGDRLAVRGIVSAAVLPPRLAVLRCP